MKRKPVTGIAYKTERELLYFCKLILHCMEGNLNFQDPNPSLSMTKTAQDNFELSLLNYERGNAFRTLDKKAKRLNLEAIITQLAVYVETEANGDPDKILSSGFEVSKDSYLNTIAHVPLIKQIEDGKHSGAVIITVESENENHTLSIACRKEDEEVWKYDVGKTRNTISITRLHPGKYYVFKAMVSNAAGDSGWSGEVRFVVR